MKVVQFSGTPYAFCRLSFVAAKVPATETCRKSVRHDF